VVFYQKAIKLKPNSADAHYRLGYAYVEMGRKQEALQIYRRLLTLDKQKAQELYAEVNKSK
jgi:tetratricopeptide (TPR) repeat protein